MNHYPHHIGDFDKATRHLNRLERSIYRDLLDVYYETELPLTLELDRLKRKILASTQQESTAVEQVLSEFFLETPSGWFHSRCDVEILKFKDNTTQKALAGKASAAAKAARKQQALNGRLTDVERHFNGASTNQNQNQNQNLEPKPRTYNQEPETRKQELIPISIVPLAGATPEPKKQAVKKEPPPTAETWNAYANAYLSRYKVMPVRNLTVNGQLASLVKRLGADEAPQVASWYVGHQNQFYVGGGHSVGLLLRDCEKLRTQWATGRQVTMTQAYQADKTQTNLSAFAGMIEEAKLKEQSNGII